jgi:hypothetical protein
VANRSDGDRSAELAEAVERAEHGERPRRRIGADHAGTPRVGEGAALNDAAAADL